MNKMTKGAIAGAAGVVLLLGGAGTFALWNDSASVNAGSISTGTLTLTAGTGVWKDVSTDVTGQPTIDASTFKMVPGDTLAYTNTFTVASSGNNLKANFGTSYTAGTLPTDVSATVSVTRAGTAVANPVVANNGDVFTVTVTLAFDRATTGTTSQNATVNLNAVGVTLTQDR